MPKMQNSLFYEGKGLISGKNSSIKFYPAEPGSGITFVSDNNLMEIPALIDNVIDTIHSTTIGNNDFQVKVIEHLMAACALSNLSDIKIQVKGSEIPIADGSSKVFYELLSPFGKPFDNNIKFNLSKPIGFTHKHTSIYAFPSDAFKIHYVVNFSKSPFERKWYTWDSSIDKVTDIVSARTFGYVKDLPLYQSQGFALGVDLDNTIGINDDESLTTDLRFPDEPVRHKALDLIGDLYLTGINPININAHIIAIECGHYQHVCFAKLLKESMN